MVRIDQSVTRQPLVPLATTALLLGLLAACGLVAFLVAPRGPDAFALAITLDAALVAAALALVLIDRTRGEGRTESQRVSSADAAIAAFIVLRDGHVVDANRSFLQLSGYRSVGTLPSRAADMLPGLDAAMASMRASGKAECLLVAADNSHAPVEIRLCRPRSSAGKQQVLAVRKTSGI